MRIARDLRRGRSGIMLDWIKSLSKAQKRAIMLAADCILLVVALLFAFAALGLDVGVSGALLGYLPVLPYMLASAVGVSFWLGISSIRLNAYETAAVGLTAVFAMFMTTASITFSNVAGLGLPLGTHLVFGAAFFGLVVVSRAVLLQVVLAIYRRSAPRCRVLIYGAGTTGTQLVSALRSHENIEPVAFVDDNQALHGLNVARLPVYME